MSLTDTNWGSINLGFFHTVLLSMSYLSSDVLLRLADSGTCSYLGVSHTVTCQPRSPLSDFSCHLGQVTIQSYIIQRRCIKETIILNIKFSQHFKFKQPLQLFKEIKLSCEALPPSLSELSSVLVDDLDALDTKSFQNWRQTCLDL